MPKLFKAVVAVVVLFLAAKYVIPTLAKDSCASISDLDERAQCYQDKIDKKEEEYSSISSQLQDIRSQKDGVSAKISNLASQLNVTQEDLNELEAEITQMQQKLNVINESLTDRKGKLEQKTALRNKVLRNYMKRTVFNDLELFLTSEQANSGLGGFQFATLSQMFNKALGNEAVRLITMLNTEIFSFEQDKKEAEALKNELEDSKNELVALKQELDAKKASAQNELSSLASEESEKQEELGDLQEEIDALSSKQQEILKAKYGDEGGTVGDYEAPEAKTPNPPFSPAFAAFSYGAYSHYNGMSQYGAKGRADDGKDYKEILKFYYKVDTIEKDDFPDEISVKGYGDLDYQYYLYGIAEMPSDWPMDALKAQAIAARTFAYRTGKPICTTEACQVFLKSKADNPPSRWKQAVDDTEGVILDNPSTAQYSSTTGGYINNVGWDLKGNWPGDAYEKRAGSPWFYKAWYTQTYNSGSSTCGHAHPWLSEEEMADILNSWVVWSKGKGSDKDHISPTTTSCWGGDPYSLDEMADKADDYGEKYTSVSSVSVDISNGGYTSQVHFSTNRGNVTVDGPTFKTVFNLRSPGYVSIRSRLFDLEKRN